MEYIAEIQAELNGYPGMEKLIFKQGDQNERYVVVTLLKDGVPVQVGTDVVPRVSMAKPDGKQILVDDNIQRLENGTLKIKITPQMATAAGRGLLEIGLYKQDSLLSTSAIDVLVYPGALSMVKVASSDEYQALIDALGQIAPAIDAEKKRQEEEKIRIQNEDVRIRNETDRILETNKTVDDMNFLINDIEGKLERGEFRGDSGIVVPISGMFTLSGDADGNLYAYYEDGSTPPQFEVDEDGNIYYLTPDQ